ncbi:hypothetical protein [uncultured Duncaniella sp.]|uniref:hypothetical protein n=2 Tax=uncultured Duncaniella sp. TaxID=2768039 RepID=UPI0025E7AE36|nr:hypothetical protein [uncultured Duncaniella sp.]
MRLTSAVLLLTSASLSLNAMDSHGADVTPLISDVSQFVQGVGSDAAKLIDGNASTVCSLPGASFTVKLPEGLTNNTPFRIRFTIPAGATDVPSGFAVYGMHDEKGTLKSETKFGHTTARITYDGSVEYESPTFYVRDGFKDQWWDCTHMRFDCTEILSDEAESFRLAEFQICLYDEYTMGDGALLRNNGDIINDAENKDAGNDWYKPLVDEKGHSCWNANEKAWVWGGKKYTGIIVTPQQVDIPTEYKLKIGRPSPSDLAASKLPENLHLGFPTKMKWSYQSEIGGEWKEVATLDLSGVKPGEICEIPFIIRPEYYRIKFETLENVGGLKIEDWAGGLPNTVLSRFQFYGPIKIYAPAPDPLPALGTQYPNPNKVSLNQDFFRNKLYSKVLKDFTFEHTHGIVDKTFDNNFHTSGGWLTNLDIWNEDGHLKPGVTVPGSELGVKLPDFSYDAPVNSLLPVGDDVPHQPTTTIFHEVYVIPGERVDLIPYSDIWHRSNYVEDFYRFYDYKTDEAHPDVYFLLSPRMGAYSKDGIFGGRALGKVFNDRIYGDFDWNDNPPGLRGPGGAASFYRPKVTDNDEYIDEYIAADYSQYYYDNGDFNSNNDSRDGDIKRFIDVENKVIHEPIINFRHVFHVVDGRKFADETSKDVKSNEEFLARELKQFYARANKDFKIRIINPMPKNGGVHSNRYYKNATTGKYERIGTYEIQTYRFEGHKRSKEKIENMFEPDTLSAFRTLVTNLETELNPNKEPTQAWISPDETFYRALKCKAANAKPGTYLIRLVAKTVDGERIYIDGGDEEGMSLRDIIITFLDEDHASFELEDDIKYEHSEKYLDENFQNKSVVDFDKYMALSGNPDFMEKEGEGERIKYPVPWLNCEYSFGYKHLQDYGTYTIASNADCVPYHQAATSKWDRHDRLYKNTNGEKKGFFFYANAAGDPGVIARVDIPSVCVGSTIHVSAWINSMGVYMDDDYKNNEPANVNFDLIAIMKDGREVNINNFSTGYVPNDPEHCGKWMHVYYSVTPDFSIIEFGRFDVRDVDHYQVVLVNNSVNSNGADYAIDDIRIYVSKPKVMASQLEPLCQGDDAVRQRIDMPFRNLVNSIGKTIATDKAPGENVTVYYAIFDKDRYDKLLAEHGGFTEEVFNGSVLPNLSNGGDDRWGAMTFNTNYNNNIPWDKDNEVNQASRLRVDDIECISFNVLLEDGGLYGGKHYIAALSIPGGSGVPEWTDFDISDPCTKQSEFEIVSSTVIKVDGIVKANTSDLEICENQFPVIQVDIYGIEAVTGDVKIVERTPLVDWFKGSMDSFGKMEYNGVGLDEALLNFRHIYPEATTLDCEYKSDKGFRYDETYRNTIQHFIDNGLLEFASYSFLSEPVRLAEGETSAVYHVVVIPANRQEDREIDGHLYTICNDPAELRIKVTRRAPGLLNGFENIDYPEGMKDVPLRAGLSQLDYNLHNLYMPMRSLYIVTQGVTSLKVGEDDNLYLVKTNDSEFRNLEDDPGASEDGTGLRVVGKVLKVTADKAHPDRCNAYVHFDETRFKEGYYYTLRFNYAEDIPAGVTSLAACDGQAVFTVKVVAEYQMWTGAVDESSNFNNDDNWRRVSYDELSGNSVDSKLVTDGDNDRAFSYSPLAFTKIIVPAGEEYPYMFAPGRKSEVSVYDGKKYINVVLSDHLSDNSSAGKATSDIEYDLTAEKFDGSLYCRVWYPNTCDQVHFKSGSEIANQQHLVYDKAWVDMEMTPGRWYTASSPLQAVVAGDMYLPTATARQTTELFKPMTFSRKHYDRFRPAVYQRGWDRGIANVYELPSESAAEVRNVAVALDWSDVYNDVKEQYRAGNGFSIKTDISYMSGAKPDKVMFRLPKDDDSYEYWTQDGQDHGIENGGAITRENPYRLNPVDAVVTVSNYSAGRYFLVGNPFMAHLDMKTFLETNRNVIAPKYWIMSAGSQLCAVMDKASEGFVGTIDDASVVSPMQGFFVEALNETKSIELKFSPEMISVVSGSSNAPALLRSRAAAGGAITLSALDNNTYAPLSKAVLLVSSESGVGYNDREDALLLGDFTSESPMVYTVSDNKAASINSTPLADGVEIGLLADDDDDYILRFDNIAAIDGYSIYDKVTGESHRLYDGMEYQVHGSVSGRLFLTSGEGAPQEEWTAAIRIISSGNAISAVSPDNKAVIEMSVYDVAGKRVAFVNGSQGFVEAHVSAGGFYIAIAKDSDGRVARRKVIL